MSKFESLRSEIIESQRSRSVFIKWKLILISTICFGGLGLNGQQIINEPLLVLCILPFVSIYVDMFCRQLALRTETIGVFIQKSKDIIKTKDEDILEVYEKFFEVIRESEIEGDKNTKVFVTKIFFFEHWVLFGSTLFISLSVFIAGIWKMLSSPGMLGILLITFSILAIVLAYLDFPRFNRHISR